MQPPYAPTSDLHPPMSRLNLRTRWTPDPSPPSSYQPPPTLSFSQTTPPSISNPPYSTRLSPSSDSSLTDRDISRRNLAASGLNVSAPEFVPSFAVPLATSPQPFDTSVSSLPVSNNHPYDHEQTPSPQRYPASLPSPPLYDHTPPHTSPFYQPQSHSHLMPNLNTYYRDDTSYSSPTPTPDISSSFFSHSPPSLPSHRPAHLNEATYVTAVQHFDEEFPALGKPADSSLPSTNSPPVNGRWNAQSNSSPQQNSSPEHIRAMFPKALAWDALQKQQTQKHREEQASREWQAALDQYAVDMEADDHYEDLEEARLSNDIGSLWVSTGKSVGQLYQSLRAEAAEEARLRNKYFDRAATAFKRNDGATAKRFGALGREANERMKELHRRAADAIFDARNPSNGEKVDFVDLHGLHVSEALERLPIAIGKAIPGTLRILTGTGHHTKGTGRARLRPAVKKWLQDNGYFFEEVVDANEYVGSFKVQIGA